MFKKLLLAAIAAGLVSATTPPAEAAAMVGMSCKDAAKQQYPDDRKMRRAWKKACKEHWEAVAGN